MVDCVLSRPSKASSLASRFHHAAEMDPAMRETMQRTSNAQRHKIRSGHLIAKGRSITKERRAEVHLNPSPMDHPCSFPHVFCKMRSVLLASGSETQSISRYSHHFHFAPDAESLLIATSRTFIQPRVRRDSWAWEVSAFEGSGGNPVSPTAALGSKRYWDIRAICVQASECADRSSCIDHTR